MKSDIRFLLEKAIKESINVEVQTTNDFSPKIAKDVDFEKSHLYLDFFYKKGLNINHVSFFGKSEIHSFDQLKDTLFDISHFSDLDKGGVCDISFKGKCCLVTKLPLELPSISQQEYLTARGVEFYYYNFPELFLDRLFPLLSSKWYYADRKICFKEIAHIIRSKIYNPRNNKKNSKRRKHDSLQYKLSFITTGVL